MAPFGVLSQGSAEYLGCGFAFALNDLAEA